MASGLGLVHIMGIFRARHDPSMPLFFSKKEIASQPSCRIMKPTMIPLKKMPLIRPYYLFCGEKRGGLGGGGQTCPSHPIEPLVEPKLRSDVNRSRNISNDTKEYYVPPGLVVEKELSKII